MTYKIVALIPAYNESEFITELVRDVRKYVSEVVVVADGCSDETAMLARGAGARVLELSLKKGKGRALQYGWNDLINSPAEGERGWTHLLLLDGDGQHAAHCIPRFWERLHEAIEVDAVLGVRDLNNRGMPVMRRWTNLFMTRLLSGILGEKMGDSQCGYRLVSKDFLMSRKWVSSNFEIETEMLFHLSARGWQVKEVSVPTIYGEERSSIHPIRDALRWFFYLGRCLRMMRI